MKRLFALAFLIVPYGAYAQQQAPSPETQALTTRLTAEINNNLSCTANVITLQDAIKKLQGELAEARKTHEPAKKKP